MKLPDVPPFPVIPGSTEERLRWLNWAERYGEMVREECAKDAARYRWVRQWLSLQLLEEYFAPADLMTRSASRQLDFEIDRAIATRKPPPDPLEKLPRGES